MPNVDISTSAPPLDEVAVACPPACNNSDARGRAIYVGAVADPGGGTTYACSSPPLGRRATADAAVGLMQAVLTPEHLSPSPSRTLRPVFVQGFFIKQANSLSQRCPPPPPGRRATADAAIGLMQTCSLPSAYRPRHRVLSSQYSSRSSFFLFSVGHSSSLCIYLFVKMMSEQRTSPRLRPRPPRPQLPWLQGAIICMWYSPVSTPVTAFVPLRRCNCGGMSVRRIFTFDLFFSFTVCGALAVTVKGC
jgi:hypothetical protein